MGATKDSQMKTNAGSRPAGANRKTGGDAEVEQKSIEQIVEEILANLIRSLTEKTGSGTVSELLKLISFQRELEASRPKEIIVRWVEPSTE